MNARTFPSQLTFGASVLLGHASVLWGLAVALAYFTGFVLLVTQPSPEFLLPYGLPAIGLALASGGLALGLGHDEMPTRSPWFGLAFNLLALAFAVGLRMALS